jgi:hypothetical protein
MTFKIEIRGLEQTVNKINESYSEFLERVGSTVEDALRDKTPVRTGRAQSGWDRKTSKDGFAIENPVPYVPYLERGTPKMRPANQGRGIIGPALDSVKGKLK